MASPNFPLFSTLKKVKPGRRLESNEEVTAKVDGFVADFPESLDKLDVGRSTLK